MPEGRRGNPSLYEINTARWLSGLARRHGRRFTLGSVPGAEWDRLGERGFDYVWLMGVWRRSREGMRIFRESPEWPPFKRYLDSVVPGWKEGDVAGSPYSIASYEPDPMMGGGDGLQKAGAELHKRGMGLILDFVPNHTAPDHHWVWEHPDFYFTTDRSGFEQNPSLYSQIKKGDEILYIARGKDPNFAPWSDTAQLNYFNPALREALISELGKIARYCDGLRCDMAMLVMNGIFAGNWGDPAKGAGAIRKMPDTEFWQQARAALPGLVLIAEAYWGTESKLLGLGFDYVYDKTLYDRLRDASANDIRLLLRADTGYQKKLVRFMENHDEQRSLPAFGPGKIRAAAALFSTLPGMKLFYYGQLEGEKIKLPVQLALDPAEAPEEDIRAFYERLLSIIDQDVFHEGQWRLKDVFPFADGSHQDLIAYTWMSAGRLKLVAVNLGSGLSQGIIPLKDEVNGGRDYILSDELNGPSYERAGADMANAGLHVILDGYQAHIFDIKPRHADDT